MMYYSYLFFIAIFTSFTICTSSRVLELSDKFLEVRKDGGHWLIMFYSPWCGHCKRLEPTWVHVGQALYRTNIHVGRVDCTRFPAMAKEFAVRGYPTIKYISGETDSVFNGDRTTEDIVNYALRMAGPPVQDITRPDSITTLKGNRKIFFMYVGLREGSLWEAYYFGATSFQAHGFFYATNSEIANQHVDYDGSPAVFVYKDSCEYFCNMQDHILNKDEATLNSSLYDWLNQERFETFPKVTRGNINEFMKTNKYLVLAVVEENKIQQVTAEMVNFRNMIESVIRTKKDKYHKNFQFGWIGSPELANSIAMTVLPLPYLLVINSTTKHHHIPEDEPGQLTLESVDLFLEQIFNQSAPVYGGNSLPVRMYSAYFEARTTFGGMWQGNPVLTVVLFGLPLGFLSLILYSMCCQDILDAEEEDDDDAHEKKE